jgi:hypothetical protein
MSNQPGWVAFLLGACVLVGCGSANALVKAPITQHCQELKLRECPNLSDALLEYVDGNAADAEVKVRIVAKANSPADIRRFSDAVQPVLSSLGTEREASAKKFLAMLTDSGSGSEPTPAASQSASSPPGSYGSLDEPVQTSKGGAATVGSPAGLSQPPQREPTVLTGMVRPASDAIATPCDLGPMASDAGKCKKARALIGPLVVTNIYASGGCPDELFVWAGPAAKPHWIIANLQNATLNVTGALKVDENEELVIGARASGSVPKSDPKCAVVWSGSRPLGWSGQ